MGQAAEGGDRLIVELQLLAVLVAAAVDLNLGQVAPLGQHFLLGFALRHAKADHHDDRAGAHHHAHHREGGAAGAAGEVFGCQRDLVRDLHLRPLIAPVFWP